MPHAHSPSYMHPLPNTPGTDTHPNLYTQLFLIYLSILADKVMLVRHVCMHTHTNAHAHSQMQTHVHTDSSKLECHTHTSTHVPPHTTHTYMEWTELVIRTLTGLGITIVPFKQVEQYGNTIGALGRNLQPRVCVCQCEMWFVNVRGVVWCGCTCVCVHMWCMCSVCVSECACIVCE